MRAKFVTRVLSMGVPVDRQIIRLNTLHLSDIETLLQNCALPFEDCNEHLDCFFGVTSGDKLRAIGALQTLGSVALLRSIAVLPEDRGKGLAGIITQYLLDLARSKGIVELYLLTETAENYFTRFGFRIVDRDTVADEIKSTRQYTSLCPSSAQAMRLPL